MADAWARVTGEPGIALVTGGPGHANAVSALYTAQMSASPVLLLSGHAPNNQAGTGAFQEMAQADMARPVTKAAWASRSGDAIASDLEAALQIARSGRPGPVNLNMPSDALEAPAEMNAPPQSESGVQQLAAEQSKAVMDMLVAAAKPVILAGPTLMSRKGRERMQELEYASGIPVVGMESPRGLLDPSLGAFAEVLAQADRVLLLESGSTSQRASANSRRFDPIANSSRSIRSNRRSDDPRQPLVCDCFSRPSQMYFRRRKRLSHRRARARALIGCRR
jgi:acetolactate synthase I/II/III large subunit